VKVRWRTARREGIMVAEMWVFIVGIATVMQIAWSTVGTGPMPSLVSLMAVAMLVAGLMSALIDGSSLVVFVGGLAMTLAAAWCFAYLGAISLAAGLVVCFGWGSVALVTTAMFGYEHFPIDA
jgi:hypothetical protein